MARPSEDRAARRAAHRSRRAHRRLLLALLGVAAVLVAILVGWAFANGSGGGAHSPSPSAARANPGATTAAATAVTTPAAANTAAIVPGPARVRPMVAYPRITARWRNPEPWTGQPPAILTTSLLTDAAGNRVTIAWFRQSRTQVALYPGLWNPCPGKNDPVSTFGCLPADPARVPVTGRAGLVATFNSGFYEKDAAGGFYAHGTLYHDFLPGLATIVETTDGQVDIIRWSGGPRPGPGIVMARQNFRLLVLGGHVSPVAGILSDWGITWHGGTAVWRSALGIDRSGNLLYAAGPAQTVSGIATALIHAGAVRAMQLDINPEWPNLTTFRGPHAARPTLAVPNFNQTGYQYLNRSIKDFFAISLRTPGSPVSIPW